VMARMARWLRSRPLGAALVEVLGTPARFGGFLVTTAAVTFVYTILLPFEDTQRVQLANWDYLNASLLTWAIAFGVAMGLVLSVQVYSMRKIVAARAASSAVGGVAFVGSLLPSFLCCTPIVPSILAFVGFSGVGLYTTTGLVQHFFAIHQAEFLSTSLVLLGVACWWGLHKVARSSCLGEKTCRVQPALVSEIAAPGRGVSHEGPHVQSGTGVFLPSGAADRGQEGGPG
jgi:hypothetical protein